MANISRLSTIRKAWITKRPWISMKRKSTAGRDTSTIRTKRFSTIGIEEVFSISNDFLWLPIVCLVTVWAKFLFMAERPTPTIIPGKSPFWKSGLLLLISVFHVTYRTTWLSRCLNNIYRKQSAQERVLPPFYDETTNKADFHMKIPLPPKSFKLDLQIMNWIVI